MIQLARPVATAVRLDECRMSATSWVQADLAWYGCIGAGTSDGVRDGAICLSLSLRRHGDV